MKNLLKYGQRFWNDLRAVTLVITAAITLDQAYAVHQFGWALNAHFHPVTILSYLPRIVIETPWVFWTSFIIFLTAGALWTTRMRPKVTATATVIALLLFECFFLQNVAWTDHRLGLPFFILILLNAEEFFLSKKTVLTAAKFGVVWFYFSAGIEKLFDGGFWPNGTTLQVFAHSFGRTGSWLRQRILENVFLAQTLQWGVLAIELGSPALFHRRLRWIWLIAIGFLHVGIEELMGYRYLLHAVLAWRIFTIEHIHPLDGSEPFDINFRKLESSDFRILYQWLREPHVQEFYQRTPMSRADVAARYGPRVRGLDAKFQHAHIVTVSDKRRALIPIGKLQCYEVADTPVRSITIDLFIGEPQFLRKGIGQRMLYKYLTDVAFPLFPDATHCIISHIVSNYAAIRCSKSVGFKFLRNEMSEGHEWAIFAVEKSSIRLSDVGTT